jgi:PIN domain nuclease of toxin-antitoxin system
MKYLLDTHAIIWYFGNSPKLPNELKDLIDDPDIIICVCSISLWEIAIKISLGKLEINLSLTELLDIVNKGNFNIMQIENEHLNTLYKLPFLHKDPFDRFLISTALSESLTIITKDENIQKYDVPWVW